MIVSAISFVGLAVSAVLTVRSFRAMRATGTPLSASALAWSIVFMAFQAFLGIYAAIGLVQNDVLAGLIANAVLCACAWAVSTPQVLVERLRTLTSPTGRFSRPLIAGIVIVLVAALFAGLALEVPSNHNLLWGYPLCLLLEWALIAAVMVGLYLIFQRRGAASAVVAFALYGLGVAEYFVITFKSMPIQPGDISALSTAMAVAGTGYTYELSAFCLYGMALLAIAFLLCHLAGCLRPAREQRTRRALLINLLVGVLCLAGVGAHVTMIDYYHTLNITVYTWRPLESYYRQGFLPTFISGAQTIKPPVPAGYSVDEAEKLIDDYAASYDESEGVSTERAEATAQFDAEKPTVITIMNETFSDLSIYQQMHANYNGPEFFKSLPDALSRGVLYVSAYGGGTCNTEFEYLTGNSMANLGAGVYPYTIYNLTNTDNLAAQFKKLGYTTTAMHPNHGTNWNRENVYQDFGFDQFLTIQDFQNADKLRGMVTDEATYDKILELLDTNSNPQFIFDVTMQNHSGYDTGLIPADKQVNLSIDGTSNPEVNEYVSLIQESDRALKSFIDKLRKLDRKVILVFFGDHQPFFPSEYNDRWFSGEDETTHAMRLWQTDYIIWANYDVAGNSQTSQVDDLSTNYLGATLMNLIGAPLSNYQKAQISLRNAMPAINSTGYEDASKHWHLSNASTSSDEDSSLAAALQARSDYAKMQYYELFRDGKDVYTKHAQTEANETDPNLAPGTTKIK